ncbi:MAG TPA: DivIVA domain-containing protein [Solirubrobacteraceae bacterium]
MALDRQSIEKKDFPIGRRGYEPASVDAHLAKVAREVEALQRAPRPARAPAPGAQEPTAAAPAPAASPAVSLATIASEQVQAIVQAAETGAAAIEAEARANAAQVHEDAAGDAERTRDAAIARSQEHVGKVRDATTLMLQRVDAMESELGALVDSLRTGANRLSADLSLLSGNMGELYAAASGPSDAPLAYEPEIVLDEIDTVAEADAPEPEPAAAGAAAGPDDVEGARLIALNMALNGQTREETDTYLAENFDLDDRAGLLDEVYATVDG